MAEATLRHKDYRGSVEVSIEDGCLHGRVLFIDDMVTYEGETVPELQANFAASVDRYLADCELCGKSPDRPCSGTFQIRIGADLHRRAAHAAASKNIGLNELATLAIRHFVETPSTIDVSHHHAVTILLQAPDGNAARTTLTANTQIPTKWTTVPTAVH